MTSGETWLRSGWLAACLLLAGCAGHGPVVLFDTPTGAVPLNAPRPAVVLPPALSPVPVPPVVRDGTYSGTAEVLMTGGGLCLENRSVGGFQVHGDAVRYGGFQGTITPDGGLEMAYGYEWIIGRFDGAVFHGQLDMRGGFDTPRCTYRLTLVRTGP